MIRRGSLVQDFQGTEKMKIEDTLTLFIDNINCKYA